MRESSKASLCGVISALSVVIMLLTYLSPFLVYTAPAFAGLLLIIVVNELGYKWSLGTFICISILSFFIISDKEASVFYTLFFGYYPVFVLFIEKSISNAVLKHIAEFVVFNASCILSVVLCYYFFGIGLEDFDSSDYLYNIIFVLLLNIMCFVYTNLINKLQILYKKRFRSFFRKMFNLK